MGRFRAAVTRHRASTRSFSLATFGRSKTSDRISDCDGECACGLPNNHFTKSGVLSGPTFAFLWQSECAFAPSAKHRIGRTYCLKRAYGFLGHFKKRDGQPVCTTTVLVQSASSHFVALCHPRRSCERPIRSLAGAPCLPSAIISPGFLRGSAGPSSRFIGADDSEGANRSSTSFSPSAPRPL